MSFDYLELTGLQRSFHGQDSFGYGAIVEGDVAKVILWLMSCRVLKRDMEYAMMEEFVGRCRERGIRTVRGFYYPTQKNAMVRDFYALFGYSKVSEDAEGNSVWELSTDSFTGRKHHIAID